MFRTLNALVLVLLLAVPAFAYGPMDLGARVKTISFNKTGASSTQYVDVGFEPVAIHFMASTRTSAGNTTNGYMVSHGLYASGENHSLVSTADEDATTITAYQIYDTTYSVAVTSFINRADWFLAGYVSSTDSNGFTMTWDTNTVQGYEIIAECFGGNDIDTAYLDVVSAPSGGGSQSLSGFGETPFLIMTMGGNGTTATGAANDAGISFGWAASATEEFSSATGHEDSTANDNSAHGNYNSAFAQIYLQGDTLWTERTANVTSFDANGVTFNWTNNSTQALMSVLFIGGNATAHVGIDSIPVTGDLLVLHDMTSGIENMSWMTSIADDSVESINTIQGDAHHMYSTSSRPFADNVENQGCYNIYSDSGSASGQMALSFTNFFAFFTYTKVDVSLTQLWSVADGVDSMFVNSSQWVFASGYGSNYRMTGFMTVSPKNFYHMKEYSKLKPAAAWGEWITNHIEQGTPQQYVNNTYNTGGSITIGGANPFGNLKKRMLVRPGDVSSFFTQLSVDDSLIDSMKMIFPVKTNTNNCDSLSLHALTLRFDAGTGSGFEYDTIDGSNWIYRADSCLVPACSTRTMDTTWTTAGGDYTATPLNVFDVTSDGYVEWKMPDSSITDVLDGTKGWILRAEREDTTSYVLTDMPASIAPSNFDNYWSLAIWWHDAAVTNVYKGSVIIISQGDTDDVESEPREPAHTGGNYSRRASPPVLVH